MVCCCLKTCSSNANKREINVHFHRWPRETKFQKIWNKYCKAHGGCKYDVSRRDGQKKAHLCSKHFSASSYLINSGGRPRVKHDAVPTLELGNTMNAAAELENFYSRCLLCTCTPDITPHLNVFSEAGSQLLLAEKINKYLDIQIVSELPKNVCNSCMEKLEVTHELATSSQKARVTLLQIKQQIENFGQEIKQEISDSSVPELDSCQPTTDSAAICYDNSTNSILIDTPTEVLHVSFVECPQPNNFQGELTFHDKERDGDLTPEEENEIATEESNEHMEDRLTTLDIQNTDGDFETQGYPPSKTNIIYQKYGGAVKCDICSDWQIDIYSLIQHKNKIHYMNLSFDCEHCGKSFSKSKRLWDHIGNVHAAKDHVCEVCGKSFTKWSYSKHLRWHRRHAYASQVRKLLNTSMETKQCGMCNHRVTNKYSILTHINSKHLDVVVEPLPFWCDLCNREFRNQENLMRHLYNLHKPKLQCNFCEKLVRRKNMMKHLQHCNKNDESISFLNNQSSKTNGCDQCGAKYVHSELLAWHIENCHGNNPTVQVIKIDDNKTHFQCIFCRTEFEKQIQVISHLRVKHQLAKLPYQCKFCNKQFIRTHTFLNHEAFCKGNKIRPVQVEETDPLAENIEQPIGETLISEIDIVEHEIKLEQDENQLDCLPLNVDVEAPLKLGQCQVLEHKFLECDLCRFYTNKKTKLATHMQAHHEPNTSDVTRSHASNGERK